jgi:hypothetical protein
MTAKVSVVRIGLALGGALLLAACQTNPKQTVLNLDTTDPRWKSRGCVQARRAVFEYNDGERLRGLAGLANHATPYVGTAASTLLNWRKDPERARLNEKVRAACVSPPRRLRQTAAPQGGDRRSKPRRS